MGPWDAEEITLAQSGQPHETGVNRIAVEKQRKRLVLTGGRDGSVAISELSTLQVTSKALKDDPELASSGQTVGHKDSVEGLAWLPQDSRLFTSGAMDGFLKIWDAAEGVSVMSLDLHSSVRNLAINNQAKVAVALEDATLRLVDLRLGRPVNTMQGHTKPPLSVVWDHLEHLFSGGMDGTVRAWDIRMGARSLFLCDPYAHEGAWPLKRKMPEKPQRVQEEWQHEEAKPEPYRFRSMKRVLGTDRRFEEGSVRMLTTSDSLLDLEPQRVEAHSSSSSEEKRRTREQFAREAEWKSRHVFGPPRRQYEHEASMAHRGAVTSVSFLDDRLLSCGVDGKVRCWDPKTGHLQAMAHKREIKSDKVLAKCEAGLWRDVNVECSREEKAMQMSALGYPDEVCMIPEEELLAVYGLRSSRCLCRLAAHKGAVLCCEALNGEMLSGGADGLLLHWRSGARSQCSVQKGEVILLD
ncbi:unnamed protein product [Durusdinium trenchii]|uniref:Uncharacterized protein n=2 Tax=Durusdinium trenchii TaxID=1381693 RepID=A0ABP0LP91_9DINO